VASSVAHGWDGPKQIDGDGVDGWCKDVDSSRAAHHRAATVDVVKEAPHRSIDAPVVGDRT
jgi:hypothetical protein